MWASDQPSRTHCLEGRWGSNPVGTTSTKVQGQGTSLKAVVGVDEPKNDVMGSCRQTEVALATNLLSHRETPLRNGFHG
jgi:hypothetical protein